MNTNCDEYIFVALSHGERLKCPGASQYGFGNEAESISMEVARGVEAGESAS